MEPMQRKRPLIVLAVMLPLVWSRDVPSAAPAVLLGGAYVTAPRPVWTLTLRRNAGRRLLVTAVCFRAGPLWRLL